LDLKSSSISHINFVRVTAENVEEAGVFCIKNKKADGYKSKLAWFKQKINEGLRIIIAQDENEKQLGFIEYLPSEIAWRPIHAINYLFIQCIALFAKDARGKGLASELIKFCESDAKAQNKVGICAMASKGPWMANQSVYQKNGMKVCAESGRFELLHKSFNEKVQTPRFNDWQSQLSKYQGWHLVYSDQCPWHEKSVADLYSHALDEGIDLQIHKIETPLEAQMSPSGFGTYSLIHNGKLLADHYISKTRFKNILIKENLASEEL
jgi:GNAT superfamily N-acetyltransferase